MAYLIHESNFRTAFRVFSLVPLFSFILTIFLVRPNININEKKGQIDVDGEKENMKDHKELVDDIETNQKKSENSFYPVLLSLLKNIFSRELWSNKAYVCYMLGVSVFLFGYFIPFVFMVSD